MPVGWVLDSRSQVARQDTHIDLEVIGQLANHLMLGAVQLLELSGFQKSDYFA